MELILPTTTLTVALGCVLLICSIIATWQKIVKNTKRDRALHEAKMLQSSKEEARKIKLELEARLDKMDLQISHLKETYAAEVKVLGEKIDSLRSELHGQHSQMITLLSKLIDSK